MLEPLARVYVVESWVRVGEGGDVGSEGGEDPGLSHPLG